MKQKLQDLLLLLKQEKKYQMIVLGLVLCVVYLFIAQPPEQGRRRPQQAKDQSQSVAQKEAYQDLVTSMKEDLVAVKDGVTKNSKDIDDIKQSADKDRARVAEIFKKMLDRLADVQAGAGKNSQNGPQVLPDSDAQAQEGQDSSVGAELASWGGDAANVAPPAPPAPKKIAVIAPGDSVRIKLLAGVNAPTDGTPYPVVFKLIDDVRGPDSSALPLGEARLVAAAQGSLTDSRALFRLTTINIRLPNGEKKILPVDGWVVGEDGIRGMEGILIDPIGKVIAGVTEAGVIQGIGQGFAAGQTTTSSSFIGTGTQTTLTGSPLIYAGGTGVADGASELAKIIKQRSDMLVPHVKVYSGREATAVFSQPVNITDLYDAIEDGESNFASSVD